MSYTRRKVDLNQADIVSLLRDIPGVTVETKLSQLGRGAPDIMVGMQGQTYLYEIKSGEKEKLTADEKRWCDNWTGHYLRVNCIEDILRDLGIMI